MEMVIVLGGVLGATAVVFCYLLFIWWLDRYEREPLWLVGATFSWGAIGGICCGIALSAPLAILAVELFGPELGDAVTTVVVAPLAEEFTKGLVFLLLIRSMHLDNATDGLIYGAATGLGFAAVENLMYFAMTAQEGMAVFIVTVLIRTLFTALVHCISSALLGIAIGYAQHRSGAFRWILYPGIGFSLAVINHALWNLSLTLAETMGSDGVIFVLLGLAMVVAASLMMFAMTQFCLKREHDFIRRFLLAEAEHGVLPRAHAEIIPYTLKRRKKGWLPAHVPQKTYVKAATMLAFRHHQLEVARGARREQYLAEIARYREEVRALLAPSR